MENDFLMQEQDSPLLGPLKMPIQMYDPVLAIFIRTTFGRSYPEIGSHLDISQFLSRNQITPEYGRLINKPLQLHQQESPFGFRFFEVF